MAPENEQVSEVYSFLRGGGEMGRLVRNFDWTTTSLGTPDQWPQSLRTTLGIVLHSAFPMFLFWGEELLCFYNDAFRPSLRLTGKHPAIGEKGIEVWQEIWPQIGPMIEQVMQTGEAVWMEDQLIPFTHYGKAEDIYWTYSFSPVFGNDGAINGVFVTCTDTTSKVKNVARLQESEKRFNTLIAESPLAIAVFTGSNYKIELANKAYAELANATLDELKGRNLFDMLPEAKQHFKAIIDRVFVSGEPYFLNEHPFSVLKNDTEERTGFLNVIYQPYAEESGQTTGIMVLCQDVSDQVAARHRAEESEQRLRMVVENAPFPIGVYTGREMRIQLVNQAIKDVWGKGGNLIGKTYADVLPELDGTGIYQQLDSVFTTGIPYHTRNQQVDLVVNGTLKSSYFNYSFTPLHDTTGKIYGVMNTAADVTDIVLAKHQVEQSEKNLHNMILQAPVAMCIMLGPQHKVTVANDLMIALWGKPRETVMNKPVFEGLPDAREQGLEDLLSRVYHSSESFMASERPVQLLRNGRYETIYQNFVYQPYKNAAGETIGVIAATIDVTEQVLARQKIEEVVAERTRALADANSNLQRSNAELAQFAYIASHDLQEPVRKVSTFSQMLETSLGEIDERSRGYIEKIKNSSARMLTLIKDVLAYSELTRISHAFTKVDLQQVIDDIKTDFELLIDQKKAQIVTQNLPVVDAIPMHMAQLFGNLVSNALKFARKDTVPVISVTSTRFTIEELNADYYSIEVTDNGIGFSQEYATQIFNIFQRLHGKKDYDGTGIGLAMCQRIVQNHNGDIFAQSTPGEGSTFTVILPVVQRINEDV